jgi:hypothetical protein
MEANSVAKGLVLGGMAACLAETITMPIDFAKVRLQVSGADGHRVYRGAFDVFVKTIRFDGARALWKGLQPALLRQVLL